MEIFVLGYEKDDLIVFMRRAESFFWPSIEAELLLLFIR